MKIIQFSRENYPYQLIIQNTTEHTKIEEDSINMPKDQLEYILLDKIMTMDKHDELRGL